MSPARLAARCVPLLGATPGPVTIVAPAAPRLAAAITARLPVATDGTPPAAAIVAFLRVPARPAERQTALQTLAHQLPSGAPLVLVDHNQPRTAWRRAAAMLILAATGFRPSRARYPAARELAALGFEVERLELANGERIQLIRAIVRPEPTPRSGEAGAPSGRL